MQQLSGHVWNVHDRCQLSDSAAAGAVFCGATDQPGVGAARGGEHQAFSARSERRGWRGPRTGDGVCGEAPGWKVGSDGGESRSAEFTPGTNCVRGTAEKASTFSGSVEVSTFGSAQYQWHPAQMRFMAHAENSGERTIVATSKGFADPDGPIVHTTQDATKDATYELPAASVVVIRGNVSGAQ
jgi:hypothetical protein